MTNALLLDTSGASIKAHIERLERDVQQVASPAIAQTTSSPGLDLHATVGWPSLGGDADFMSDELSKPPDSELGQYQSTNYLDSWSTESNYGLHIVEAPAALTVFSLNADETLSSYHSQTPSYVDQGMNDPVSQSPLHCAAENARHHIAVLLIGRGAEVDKLDASGQTPMHIASRLGHVEILKILLVATKNVNMRDDQNNTALHYAVANGHEEAVVILLESGASVE